MKSKRRHELQTNELADQLGHWIDRVRPHVGTFLMVVLAGVAGLGAWYYFSAHKEYETAQAWRAYMFAGSNPQGDIVKELNMVADEFPDTQAGLWAALTAADVEGGRAVRMLFSEKATAETGLDNAIKGYQRILDSKAVQDSSMLQSRANFGLAQTFEAAGELDKAMKRYQEVVDLDKDSAAAKVAGRRAERLALGTTKKWYNWFANQTPEPPKPAAGLSPGSGFGMPSDLNLLPEGPSKSFLNEQPEGADSTSPAKKDAEADKKETVPAKTDPTPTEPTKKAAAPSDTPTLEGPAVEPPKTESPKTESPKTESPKTGPPEQAEPEKGEAGDK